MRGPDAGYFGSRRRQNAHLAAPAGGVTVGQEQADQGARATIGARQLIPYLTVRMG